MKDREGEAPAEPSVASLAVSARILPPSGDGSYMRR